MDSGMINKPSRKTVGWLVPLTVLKLCDAHFATLEKTKHTHIDPVVRSTEPFYPKS
jgi:hypothetical protein